MRKIRRIEHARRGARPTAGAARSGAAPGRGADSRRRLLDAALRVIRRQGYAATSVDDLCAEAGLTKGGFFHHFAGKEDLAVAAAAHWSETTGAFFAAAPYRKVEDPLERVFAYVDFRRSLLSGAVPEFTCYAGTTVQETYATHPALREACARSILGHAAEVAKDIAEARRLHAPKAPWSAESLARHTQVVLQGAFVLAKATGSPRLAIESVDHLKRYLELLFGRPSRKD